MEGRSLYPGEVKKEKLVSNGDLVKATEIDLGALTSEGEEENKIEEKRREGGKEGRVACRESWREGFTSAGSFHGRSDPGPRGRDWGRGNDQDPLGQTRSLKIS